MLGQTQGPAKPPEGDEGSEKHSQVTKSIAQLGGGVREPRRPLTRFRLSLNGPAGAGGISITRSCLRSTRDVAEKPQPADAS